MPDDQRVLQLLEEALESGDPPDAVCGDRPDLLPEVRRRWEDCRRVEAELDVLFPPSSVPTADRADRCRRGVRPWAELPRVPGYDVEKVLGRGGVGVVYMARHLRLHRPVAIKMLLSGAYAGRVEVARFMHEARAVAGLRHPHVVQVFDFGECEGLPFYTMEFVEGGTLAERLGGVPQRAGPAAEMLATLADAIESAHRGGIVHRDLKPANVLLTADGSPKITDFGLARQIGIGADDGLTVAGGRVGTLSYMAPEQACGQAGAAGPAADVYALGAILYEMLTGRPPFRGESAAETERQLLAQEPVPPSKLNGRVPRDLETICLKCLAKDGRRRYGTAAALAADLRRFGRGQPIEGRRVHLSERAVRWAARYPGATAAVAASLVLSVALAGVLLRMRAGAAERRAAVTADLRELGDLESWQHWSDARATLQRARARLDDGGPADLRRRLDDVQRDLDLVDRLTAIHLSRATSGGLPFYRVEADRDYTQAFERDGLTRPGDAVERAAAAVAASPIRAALVAALDDWALSAINEPDRRRLLAVAHRADAVTAGGDDPVRGLAALPDSADLSGPTRAVVVTGRPVSALLTLGERLTLTGRDPRDFLKRVQLEHPADFWVNLALGDALLWPSPGEAGIYYRAALAARPEAAVGYCAVADALLGQKRPDEAITYYRKALAIDPKFARGESNFGRALRLLGRYDEAFTCDLNALQIDPNFAWAHYDMARSFADGGRLEEAVDHYRVIVAATPLSPEVQADYRSAMLRLGRGEQAWAEWRDGLASGALCGYDAWNGYAELSLYLGHADEYRRARATLLARFVDRPQPQVAEPVARTCLLVPDPDSPGRRQAVALADWSEAAQRGKPYHAFAAFAQGLAAFRTGNDGRAMSIMRGRAAKVLGPCPGLVTAMALMREGRGTEARATLATAVLSFDWRPERADRRDLWMYHVLRREAEAKVLPNLPAFLAGQYRPTDNDERLALLGLCQANGRWADYAALYADAVAADPAVVETAPQDVRRWAAGAAAMAAGDGATPTATRWRALGVQWMQAELDLRMGRAATVDPAGRGTLRRALGTWLTDPDLAPLRDPAALARMPEAERSQCANLWAAVRAAIDLLGQPA